MQLSNPSLFRSRGLVGGNWINADDGRVLSVTDPASGAFLGQVPMMGAGETRRAIQAANEAWGHWRKTTAKERAVLLHRWYDLILLNTADLARLITAECGKPLTEGRGEVVYGASFIEWFAEEAKRAYGETIPSPASDKRLLTIRQPVTWSPRSRPGIFRWP